MSAPAWMASPPELHSALLSSGPGAGPVLAAAETWRSLSAEYAEAADQIGQLLTWVQAGLWEGSGAESYVAAHAPYVAWLLQAGADSAATAQQLDTAAAAYAAALAAMPTLAELAANHVTHATLAATNFFGINTIPIALNEADYVRMWTQAAATMSSYQASSTAALAATPHSAPAPTIVKDPAQSQVSAASWQNPTQYSNPLQGLLDQLEPLLKSLGIVDGQVAHDPMISNQLTTFVSQILQNFGANWNPAAGTLNGQVYDYYADASQPIWYLARSLELFEDFLNIAQNPGQAIQAFQYLAALALFDWPTHIAQLATTVSQAPALLAAAAGALVAPAGAASGLAGLAGLATFPQSQPLPVVAESPVGPGVWPASANLATIAAPGTAPTSAPAPAPTASTGGPPPPASPPSTGATGFVAPYAVAPPGIGFGPGLGLGVSSTEKRRAPESDTAAAAAASGATTRTQRRPRRRQRHGQHAHGDEFINVTMNQADESAATEASDRGSGPVGFAGTVAKHCAVAVGLTTRADDPFGCAPTMPMLPASWEPGDQLPDR
jgi:PPE-repeat protein